MSGHLVVAAPLKRVFKCINFVWNRLAQDGFENLVAPKTVTS